MKISGMSGAMRRIAPVCAALALAACASTEAPQSAGHTASIFAYSEAAGAEDAAADVLAAVEAPVGSSVTLSEASFNRVLIADSAIPRVTAHETGLSAVEKTDNLSVIAQGAPLILAQGTANNGGWEERENVLFHAYSGMSCLKSLIMLKKTGDEEAEKYFIPLAGILVFDDVGRDTACHYEDTANGVYLTVYASDWAQVSLADHFGAALRDMLNRFAVVQETPTIVAQLEVDEQKHQSSIEGPTASASFLLAEGQLDAASRYKTALWLNKTGSWHVKIRASYAVEVKNGQAQFNPAELVAAIYHAAKLAEVDQRINSGGVSVSY